MPIAETTVDSSEARARTPRRIAIWAAARSGLLLVGLLWVLWVANFNDLRFGSTDPQRPFSFLKLLFGDASRAFGYQFGLAFLWSPFYALAKLLSAAGIESVGGRPVAIAMITLSTSLLVIVVCGLLVPVLRSLGLGHESFVLFAAVFGSPLFYYGTFEPGLSQVADTLLYTALVALLYRYFRADPPSLRLPVVIGAVAGYAATVRLFNGFAAVAIVLGLVAYRRFAAAAVVAVLSGTVFAALSSIPIALGASLTGGYASDTSSALRDTFAFRPESPLLMLFSDRRGLFVWTPVTLLGVVGFALLLLSRRNSRPFLVLTGALGVSVVAPFAGVFFWTGSTSFSERYFTPLFPLVVLGLAELVRRSPKVVIPVASLAVMWSVGLAFNGPSGVGGTTDKTGAASWLPREFVRGSVTPAEYVEAVYQRGRLLKAIFPNPVSQVKHRDSLRRRATP